MWDIDFPESAKAKPQSPPVIEGAYDILRRPTGPLGVFFAPSTVAVIGASETPGSVGRTVLWNLISNPFGGTVYPVNAKRPSVLGIKSHRTISSIPESVDLAVIVTPAQTVPGIVAECVEKGVRGAIIISAGFKECGAEGLQLEQRVLEEARRGLLRVIGPNCLGVMSPLTGLNATFARAMARPGNVAFISHSGALCTAVLDWSLRENVGFSNFISIGSMVDVGWGDLIDYLGDDPKTRSIVIYMETIGDARPFLSAAREVSLSKPIIVIKAGRSEEAARAAASHTGALTGSDEVLDAAFRRCGVLRVGTIADLFHMAEVLSKQPRPRGPRLTIVTNAGGPGVLATDALITSGATLADLNPSTVEALNNALPAQWSHNNPIDVLGDAGPDRYAKAVQIAAADPNSDGLLVVLTPQAMTEPTRTAEELRAYAQLEGKPVLASWMGGADVASGEEILNRSNIPTFSYPDTAARAFSYMWRYSYNLRGIYETPDAHTQSELVAYNRAIVQEILQRARQSGRTVLSEYESKKLLAAYEIPTVETRVAASEGDALKAAEEIGYPVVLKVFSETVTHKTDIGGVILDLPDATAVRRAFRTIRKNVSEKKGVEHFMGVTVQPMVRLEGYEIIVGSSLDPQFGPVLLFGSGGQLVEVYRDRALALPPLTSTLARRMMEQTRVYTALLGVRGRRSADIGALEQLLVRFGELVSEQFWIREIDINPLLVSPDRIVALDARVILHGREVEEKELPRLAIRPYPVQYMETWQLKDGRDVTIRPIRPSDEPMMVRFHETLSERSVYYRYFHPMRLNQRVAHERLTRMCFIDYAREMALVAVRQEPSRGQSELLGVGRLIRLRGTGDGEFAVLVSDRCQRQGLGTELLRRLVDIGRREGMSRIVGDILPENRDMLRVCEKLGFSRHYSADAGAVRAELIL